jgi:hypothetical protein
MGKVGSRPEVVFDGEKDRQLEMQAKMIEDLISKENRVGDHLPGTMRDSFSPNHGHIFTPNKPSE